MLALLRSEGAKFEFYSPSGPEALFPVLNKLLAVVSVDGLASSMLTQGLLVLVIESAEQMSLEEAAMLNRIVAALGMSAVRVLMFTGSPFNPMLHGPLSHPVGKTCHWFVDESPDSQIAATVSATRVEPTLDTGLDDSFEEDSPRVRLERKRSTSVLMAVVPVMGLLSLGWLAYAAGWLPSALADMHGQASKGPVYFQCQIAGPRAAVEKIQQKISGDIKSQIVSVGETYRLDIGPIQLSKDIDTVRARLWSIGACAINPIHTIGS